MTRHSAGYWYSPRQRSGERETLHPEARNQPVSPSGAPGLRENIRLIRENVSPSVATLADGPGMGYLIGIQTVDTALLTMVQMQSRLNYWVTYCFSGGFIPVTRWLAEIDDDHDEF